MDDTTKAIDNLKERFETGFNQINSKLDIIELLLKQTKGKVTQFDQSEKR